MGTRFALGHAALEENPGGSWFFEFPGQQRLSELEGVVDWKFDSCALGGARCKKERWEPNVSELAKRRAECQHLRGVDECAHAVRPDGTRHFHTKEEREFTAERAYHVALIKLDILVRKNWQGQLCGI